MSPSKRPFNYQHQGVAKKRLTLRQQQRMQQDVDMQALSPQCKGHVIKREKKYLQVLNGAGEVITCLARRDLPPLVVGDAVALSFEANPPAKDDPQEGANTDKLAVVIARAKRERSFEMAGRTLASGIDRVMLMQSNSPHMPWLDIEKILFAVHLAGLESVLIYHKIDLLDEQQLQYMQGFLSVFQRAASLIGLSSVLDSHAQGLASLPPLEGHQTMLLGPSGVGKSSIIAALTGQSIKTAPLNREGYGKHTTSVPSAYPLKEGWVIDLPGIREMDLLLKASWDQLHRLRGYFGWELWCKEACQFRDCWHIHEPGCQVMAKLESLELQAGSAFDKGAYNGLKARYEHYLKLFELLNQDRKQKAYGTGGSDKH